MTFRVHESDRILSLSFLGAQIVRFFSLSFSKCYRTFKYWSVVTVRKLQFTLALVSRLRATAEISEIACRSLEATPGIVATKM